MQNSETWKIDIIFSQGFGPTHKKLFFIPRAKLNHDKVFKKMFLKNFFLKYKQ
jgi:hypothetical protein